MQTGLPLDPASGLSQGDADQQAKHYLGAHSMDEDECLRQVIAEGGRDRVAASRCLLETAARISEMDLEERLDTLERQLDRSSRMPPPRLNGSRFAATA